MSSIQPLLSLFCLVPLIITTTIIVTALFDIVILVVIVDVSSPVLPVVVEVQLHLLEEVG